MIKSMTGYGSAVGVSGNIRISIELKSVNNRYLDCTVKLPRVYISAEEPLKAAVARHISRGKTDIFVNLDTSGDDSIAITVNRSLAESYVSALRQLAEDYSLEPGVSALDLAKFPDVLKLQKVETETDVLISDMVTVLDNALIVFDEMRDREGERLFADITARLNEIERLTALAEARSPVTVTEYRQKLETRMTEILQNTAIDEARILTEAAIFADKVAVNEEIVRIGSHLAQIRTALESGEPVGRRLDFLMQELGREINTLGSKGNDAEMAKIVVDLKAEAEKMREQIQNVE